MKNSRLKKLNKFAKTLSYVLGIRPDEFGLVPDDDGFVKIKDLVKALSEEEGWHNVRASMINEVLLTLPNPPIETKETMIRALDRKNSTPKSQATNLPTLLFTGITRKSYPVVIEKGVLPTRHPHVILSRSLEMAKRIALRRAPDPVILTVNTEQIRQYGISFFQAGQDLYLADSLPPGSFSGPPLPKNSKEKTKKDKPRPEQKEKTPGSFVIESLTANDPKQGKDKSWKRDKKRLRRERAKQWPGD